MASQTTLSSSPQAARSADLAESASVSPAESRAVKTIREVFESGRPLTYIRSSEEQRVARVLTDAGTKLLASGPVPVWTWSLTEGMRKANRPVEGPETPRAVLDFIIAHPDAAIFHLKDFHEPLRESAEIRRRLRDLYDGCRDRQKFVVISSAVRFIPEEIERSIVFLELRPPDFVELLDFLRDQIREARAPIAAGDSEAVLHQFARALQGLTLDETGYALRRALAFSQHLGSESLPALLEEKKLLINRSGVIEYIPVTTELGEVGGLETLKKWLTQRRKLFQMRDSLTEEIMPKGILMMGIPGCGKSLSVKAIASHFQ
ncbi:MAG: AAA family ATPase, partial [Acidobacteriia bacterium]|nr:AAA family ATPase [Terriglobia bacterium]